MSHRTGKDAIRTPEEIRRDLTLPVYYILIGQASVSFPFSSTSGPSQFVTIVRVRPDRDDGHEVEFPVFVNYLQWNDIVVPILQDPRWSNYLGYMGGGPGVTDDGYPSSIPNQSVGRGLYACNKGLRSQYIQLLGNELESRASST